MKKGETALALWVGLYLWEGGEMRRWSPNANRSQDRYTWKTGLR